MHDSRELIKTYDSWEKKMVLSELCDNSTDVTVSLKWLARVLAVLEFLERSYRLVQFGKAPIWKKNLSLGH